MTSHATDKLIARLPKAELHCHIEGTFEPELMVAIAERNGIALPYASVDDLRRAYDFADLQAFLDLYYQGMNVLQTEEDYFDLTHAYIERCVADNVVHTEIFFDPQGHTARGVPFKTVLDGIAGALKYAEARYGVTSRLILSFLRHLSEEDGFRTLKEAEPYLGHFVAVGLDSSEVGHPPSKFSRLFARCREMGLKLVCHAGEEGPPDYVREALFDLGVDRIDHGNRAMEDADLVADLARRQVPLTNCPLSNLSLCVIDRMAASPVKAQLDAGLLVTVNSDDPAYFGGYINANYRALAHALALSPDEIRQLARNSFTAAFLDPLDKVRHIEAVDAV